MGIFSGFLGGRSLEATLTRARKALAAGDFDGALQTVEKGLRRFPDAAVLRDTGHAVRRAQARASMHDLLARVEEGGDPVAFEQLIALYKEAGMTAEMLRLTDRFVEEHGSLPTAHLLRGEQALETFFDDLRARDGQLALDHLLKAGSLDPDSLRARMLLVEVYYAIGADRALLGQAAAIERLAGDDEVMRPALQAVRDAARPAASESVDALLAKVEVSGQLARDPSTWSSRPRRGIAGQQDAARVRRGLDRLVKEGVAAEAVAIDRGGALLGAAAAEPAAGGGGDPPAAAEGGAEGAAGETALAGVARVVARTVKAQALELDMGRFRRMVVEGPFGVMVVADAAGGVVAARGRRGADPQRIAERLAVAVEGGRGRQAS